MPSKAQLPEPRDIFDRIMGLPGLRHFYGLYAKYKSVLLYIFFGGLTTVISIGSFALCNQWLMVNELIANVISWICAVSFAYVTHRVWGFRSSAKGARQILSEALSFFSGRLVTRGIEEMMLLVFVTIARMNGMVIKVIAQFVVLVLNYFISKLVVFRSKAGKCPVHPLCSHGDGAGVYYNLFYGVSGGFRQKRISHAGTRRSLWSKVKPSPEQISGGHLGSGG